MLQCEALPLNRWAHNLFVCIVSVEELLAFGLQCLNCSWLARAEVYSVPKLICGLLVGIFALAGQTSSSKPQKQAAVVVEVKIPPPCNGLDCPPLPVPFDAYLCFQTGDSYYSGTYRLWGFPWSQPGKKLLALRGQSVEIVVREKHIGVGEPLNVGLKRIRDSGIFSSASCNVP
jgi:hypothetical protein